MVYGNANDIFVPMRRWAIWVKVRPSGNSNKKCSANQQKNYQASCEQDSDTSLPFIISLISR
jgi:hypothetical protein